MKNRSIVFFIAISTLSWFLLANSQADAVEEHYRSNCRVDQEAEKNVFIDEAGERIYHNVDQKVLWDLANDFCISLDLLVAYNFILVPREPVQYTYIKLPPGPEEIGWFPGRSLEPTNESPTYSESLFWDPYDPLDPEQNSQPSLIDPFFSSELTQTFTWPISLNDGTVSQLYHRNHHGVDIAVPIGTPVESMANGWIIRVEEDHHIFGKLIVIDHGNDLMGVYGHLAQVSVEEGEFVWRGEQIAHSGNSGRSSAPHLHIELRKDFRYVDPCEHLANCPEFAFHGPRPLEPEPTLLAAEEKDDADEVSLPIIPPLSQSDSGATMVFPPTSTPPPTTADELPPTPTPAP